MTEKSSIKQNYEEIKKRIENAVKKSPYAQEVTFLAATKTVTAENINYATQELGIVNIGENRVQELLDKYDDLILDNVNLHFIGRLQTNKVKYIIDKVCLIHSVDSLKLAAEIEKQSGKIDKVTDILIEINSGNEENKGGISEEELEPMLCEIERMKHIRVRGLMTIAPICANSDEYRQYFEKTYKLCVDILQNKHHNKYSDIISMGMSGSFEQAIMCGSTMVRIGTSLFGKRI